MSSHNLNSGSYQIHIEVKQDISIKIGALGIIEFKLGIYIYTGSAMKNLTQRVDRHRRIDKKLRWHIDYLLADPCVDIMCIDVYPSYTKEECKRNQDLQAHGASFPIKKFGSSDCKLCHSHLAYIK